MGYFLLNPLRYLTEPPVKLLAPHVLEGMKVLEVGSGSGFFSLPLARLVGKDGKVYCLDLQPRMISILQRRAKRAGLNDRVVTIVCNEDSLALGNLKQEFDFVLAYYVVHEIPDKARLFAEIQAATKPNARLLLAEPKHVVKNEEFEETLAVAHSAGFDHSTRHDNRWSYVASLTRNLGKVTPS
jgi:ubiquinone/menaquinone biosynthesis C-methylase UbiE